MPTSPSNTPPHFRVVSLSRKKINPVNAPINGVVALRIAEYPAGNHLAARQYIRKGNPELITPKISDDLNFPSKLNEALTTNKITASPLKPKKTRKKAVLIAPNSGAAIHMNKKLAPQMAARSNNRM
jgi:hypothetical protein